MKAEQARMTVVQVLEAAHKADLDVLDSIYEKIQEAASKGQWDVTIDGYINSLVESELMKQGFLVTKGSQYNDGYTNISWKEVRRC